MWIIFLIITLIHDLQFIVMRIKVAEILLCTLFIALKALGFRLYLILKIEKCCKSGQILLIARKNKK